MKMGEELDILRSSSFGHQRTQCCLGRGLPPSQMASWSIQPFGHNRHGPKTGGLSRLCPFWGGGAGSPSNTRWTRPRPTSVLNFMLIHPTVCKTIHQHYRQDRQTYRTDTQRSDDIGRTVLQTVAQNTWGAVGNIRMRFGVQMSRAIYHPAAFKNSSFSFWATVYKNGSPYATGPLSVCPVCSLTLL